MYAFEKLGAFYLGRPHDLRSGKRGDGIVLYDAKDLMTHAVCVGMTGSGKTGLGIVVLEEAALDGIPSLVIDPKGDLTNLLLTFPDLQPEDFQPWINEDDARRSGMSNADHARGQADLWRDGLREWGQDGDRIRRLRDAAEFCIYTPGSEAGRRLSILRSFTAPPPAVKNAADLLGERVATAVTGLLTLLGIDADPIRSREHILVSTILSTEWAQGRDVDLERLIALIQTPPVSRVGVLDLDSFYPARDRFALAMAVNNLLAAPAFQLWREGDALDGRTLLFTAAGKPRVSIFSIAHLPDAERMFFVTMLLNEVLAWMRSQSGTTTLRAILYMDEIFGYLPPTANPPSKTPLLSLLKQARAFGLGVVLATQNPVDLDYKALSNAGTWFIGRLQTERDKERLLDGLESAAATGGPGRVELDRSLSALGKRIFLLHNVHDPAPQVFETRWALSYLRGPLTRDQIRALTASAPVPGASVTASAPAAPAVPAVVEGARGTAPVPPPVDSDGARPALPPDLVQVFLPLRGEPAPGGRLFYAPGLVGTGDVYFVEPRMGVDTREEFTVMVEASAAAEIDWSASERLALAETELLADASGPASFLDVPAAMTEPRSYDRWKRSLIEHLFRTRRLALMHSPAFKTHSRPGETEGEFRARLREIAREERDRRVEELREDFARRLSGLQDRVRRAEERVGREAEQLSQQKTQTAISFGATLIGALVGRKAASVSSVGRATTALRGASRAHKEAADVKRAEESLDELRQKLAALEEELSQEVDAIGRRMEEAVAQLQPVSVAPRRANVTVRRVALAWIPYWQERDGRTSGAWPT